jgi:hypothetical protein
MAYEITMLSIRCWCIFSILRLTSGQESTNLPVVVSKFIPVTFTTVPLPAGAFTLFCGCDIGLSSINVYRADEAIRTLLLASLTASVISASSCLSMLSTIHLDPSNIERHWKSSGIMYIIALSGPSAWLAIALWLFQASILAIVWSKESTASKIIVTTFIGIRLLSKFSAQLNSITVVDSMFADLILGLLGWSQGMSHYMVNLNQGMCSVLPSTQAELYADTITKRSEYLRALAKAVRKGDRGEFPSPPFISQRLKCR